MGVTKGILEGSNVSSVNSLVTMIDLARRYEFQVKLMENAHKTTRAPPVCCGPSNQEPPSPRWVALAQPAPARAPSSAAPLSAACGSTISWPLAPED